MYFPYFRGRQYEMIALRELANRKLLGRHVLPVVEPVKITSTFYDTLMTFSKNDKRIILINNPEVGDFAGKDNFISECYSQIGSNDSVIPALVMNNNAGAVLTLLKSYGIKNSQVTVILDKRDFLDEYMTIFAGDAPQYTLFPDERQIRRSVLNGKVMFEDKFFRKDRNADYEMANDEFFSDDHLYYSEEGYEGFGDYSIIGNVFDEGGFAPRAVAIHIVYFDKDRALRVRHFVSETNGSIQDVAGKFYEAVLKLKEWYNTEYQDKATTALSVLLDHASKGYYPGLPTLKKLSIMHHLELMSQYMDEKYSK